MVAEDDVEAGGAKGQALGAALDQRRGSRAGARAPSRMGELDLGEVDGHRAHP